MGGRPGWRWRQAGAPGPWRKPKCAAVRFPGIFRGGDDLHLDVGPLSGLAVTFGDAPPTSDGVRTLYALSRGEAGTRVELWGLPHCEAGRLRLVLALPALTRAAQTGRRLAVSVAVMPGLVQRLGDWPVSDWGDAPRSVDAPCPGPDGDFDAAALRLDLEAAPD